MLKNNFSLLKKFKNTKSGQLWVGRVTRAGHFLPSGEKMVMCLSKPALDPRDIVESCSN